MKLAWLTPFSANSAIGRFSQTVTDELSKQAEIDLWIAGRENLLSTSLRIIDYNPALPVDQWWPRGAYDFAICNFGEQPFQRPILEFARKISSVVVLHDCEPSRLEDCMSRALAVVTHSDLLREKIEQVVPQYVEHIPPPSTQGVESYCQRLLEFLDELRTVKPVLESIHRTAGILAELKVRPDTEIVKTVASMAAEMFCGSAEEALWNKKSE